jgi:predicted murein hydrolase (TIGR00659 family)
MIREMLSSTPVMLGLTVGVYLLAVWIRTRSKIMLLNPMLISVPVIVTFLLLFDIPAQHYIQCNSMISFMLGPSVVALGLTMYEQRNTIREYLLPILSAVVVGSTVGVASVYLLCRWFRLDEVFLLALEPKSVTVPIAMEVAKGIGGNTAITAISVALCGLFGGIFGPLILKLLHIKNPIAVGAAMGSASHGIGTARAIELGALEGAVSGLCIALMGVATAVLVPLFNTVIVAPHL